MDIRKIRAEMIMGRTIYDFPLRVTFYARVSTDRDEQLNSLENQIQFYTDLIQNNEKWTYVPGYIDEGISGTSTKKRDSFNRMIRDAKNGKFDFIITKEISRFSRSTLDSIKYTQELLEYNVAVLFQNDNINTLDGDSEFRLVVMAGVAQDEVRKLSERLKFGFRQSIKNGHVLGNNRLWGYDKKDGRLTINEREAEAVRMIFDLYANQRMGVRRISQSLTGRGYTSLLGNAFNTATIINILTNPKYKGWYCGNKTKSLDYRTKRTVFLDEDEWITYPDPHIPPLVSEELWNRANALYQQRSKPDKTTRYHGRYAYSGKLICEAHGTSFHRAVLASGTEQWRCKIYREQGAKGCSAPAIRTADLDLILSHIFQHVYHNTESIVTDLLNLIDFSAEQSNYEIERNKIQKELTSIKQKKERLLELSIDGVIGAEEFKKRNDGYNELIASEEKRMLQYESERFNHPTAAQQLQAIQTAVEKELNFEESIHSDLLSTLVDRIVVKQGSTRENICLDIYLKTGQQYFAEFPSGHAFRNKSSKNTTPNRAIRMI